jgi:hypothetical protein
MEPGHYTDPLEDALSQASQRIAQFASLIGAATQVIMQRKALHDARQAARDDERATRILNEQERLLHRQARLGWAPAHDPQWLAHADLLQTGRAWASAAGCADTDPAAASAMRKCEDRLRTLHPYAMARYDRLRGDGMSPLDATREAVTLFGRSPHVRVGDPAPPRPALGASTEPGASPSADHLPADPAEPDPGPDSDQRAGQRGQQIIERLQRGARGAGRPELDSDELTMVLEGVTNLPQDLIERLTRHASPPTRAGEPRAAATASRSAAQLAAESFPHSAADAIRAASTTGTSNSVETPVRVHMPDRARRPGPPM